MLGYLIRACARAAIGCVRRFGIQDSSSLDIASPSTSPRLIAQGGRILRPAYRFGISATALSTAPHRRRCPAWGLSLDGRYRRSRRAAGGVAARREGNSICSPRERPRSPRSRGPQGSPCRLAGRGGRGAQSGSDRWLRAREQLIDDDVGGVGNRPDFSDVVGPGHGQTRVGSSAAGATTCCSSLRRRREDHDGRLWPESSPLEFEEALDCTTIHSVAGTLRPARH